MATKAGKTATVAKKVVVAVVSTAFRKLRTAPRARDRRRARARKAGLVLLQRSSRLHVLHRQRLGHALVSCRAGPSMAVAAREFDHRAAERVGDGLQLCVADGSPACCGAHKGCTIGLQWMTLSSGPGPTC